MLTDRPSDRKVLFPRLYGEGRYSFLLGSLLLLFFFYPFFVGLRFAPKVLGGLFFIILIASVSAIGSRKSQVAAATVLAALSIGFFVAGQAYDNITLTVLTTISFGLFFLLITLVVVRHITGVKEVTADTILGAICAYLLLGMVWAMLFSLIETLAPGSFLHGGRSIAIGFENSRVPAVSNFIYYSFVTLTTLGYGDFTPNSAPAAALSSLEAVTGQLYIAILIARFVGLYISSQGKESP